MYLLKNKLVTKLEDQTILYKQDSSKGGGTTHLQRSQNDEGWHVVENKAKRQQQQRQRPNLIYQAEHSKPRPLMAGVSFGPTFPQPGRKSRFREQSQQPQQRGGQQHGGRRAQQWQEFRGGAAAARDEHDECTRCLGIHSEEECRARDKTCRKCGRLGHLARACNWY